MNDAEKFQLKLELTLNLKSAKDIQNWAIDKLDKNPADLLALEICFFSKDEEVLDYFNKISIAQYNIESEPYRVCRRLSILRECSDDQIKIYP
ncbi:hypothetical protein ABTP12_17820 [Acinetobacter baumannii]